MSPENLSGIWAELLWPGEKISTGNAFQSEGIGETSEPRWASWVVLWHSSQITKGSTVFLRFYKVKTIL